MTTPTWITVGTGGVGKTTIAAALAHALAHAGARTLVTTFDPARRLADALGVPAVTSAVVPVSPRLAALVPDAGVGARDLVERLLAGAPGHAARLATNPLLAALTGGFAGIHELVALLELARAAPRHDALVIDTAPARHALDLLALPARLGEIVDGRALAWLGALARHAVDPAPGVGARLLRWGPQRLVRTFAGAIGEAPIQAALELLAFAADVRPTLSPLLATARGLLAPAHARVVVVVAARPGVDRELADLVAGLAAVGHHPALVVVNRVPTASVRALVDHPAAAATVRQAAHQAVDEIDAARAAAAGLGAHVRALGCPLVEVAALPTDAPRAVIAVAARALGATLAGPGEHDIEVAGRAPRVAARR